jgi:hypothetical protein
MDFLQIFQVPGPIPESLRFAGVDMSAMLINAYSQVVNGSFVQIRT